jgi:hypothetical protein
MSLIELAKNGYAFQLSRLISKKVFIVVAGGNAAAQHHFEDTIQRKRTLEGSRFTFCGAEEKVYSTVIPMVLRSRPVVLGWRARID